MERDGARPRTRAALIGAWEEPEIEALSPLFPTLFRASTVAELLPQVSPAELDLVLAAGPLRAIPKALWGAHLIVFSTLRPGATLPGPIEGSYLSLIEALREEPEQPPLPPRLRAQRERLLRAWRSRGQRTLEGSPAVALTIEERPPPLTEKQDAARAQELERRARDRREEARRRFGESAILRLPMLKAALGLRFMRAEPRRGLAWLPGFEEREGWIRALLEEWRAHDPEAFPRRADWREHPEWRTPEEEELLHQSQELERKRLEMIEAIESRERHISARLAEARARADRGVRRLLHGHGERLAEATAETLEALGFEVEVLSQERGRAYLRLLDEEDPSWSALALVRGFERRAGSASDLLRLATRARGGGEAERPDRLWYIVNGPAIVDPPRRPPPLEGKEEAVEETARLGGAVISTTSLYRLYHDRDNFGVKEKLKEARGLFRYPE